MRKALFLAAMLAVLLPATARADIFEGSATDATGETIPARDITAISARYDEPAGAITATVTLAAPADADSDALVAALLERGCGATPRAVLGGTLTGTTGSWQTDTMAESEPLTRTGTAPTVTLSIADPRLANNGYDCLTVVTATEAESQYDTASVRLRNVTPPPAPTPAPTATPTPAPTPAGPPPLGPSPLTRAEKLEAALAKCANAKCKRTARKRYGPTKRERYRAALDKCRSRSCERRAKARFRGVKPAPKPTGLERKLFARSESDFMGVCGGVCWEALAFTDRRYVYVGLPEGAGIPDCRRVTYDADKGTGCATYKVKGKTLTVAGKRYTIAKQALTRAPEGDEKKGVKLPLQVFPKAGARWEVPAIEAIEVNGNPFVGAQFITKSLLMLNRSGQFVRTSVSFGSTAPGAPVSVNFASAPKDSRGTYEVLPAGTIRLAFEDGRVEVGPAFFWDSTKGRDPNRAGLHLVDRTFFGPPED